MSIEKLQRDVEVSTNANHIRPDICATAAGVIGTRTIFIRRKDVVKGEERLIKHLLSSQKATPDRPWR